ncbi:MAG: Spy/CpxP family protein refolding chaperone [Paenibacillus sp.]|nr:Spy/CpxP family protein refolding chaperone [Paenibacillus sp.]
MKKKLFSIALAFACLAGPVAVSAQTPASTPQNKEQKACCKDGKQQKRPNPFDGLNLSEKQQSELKALAESRRAEMKKNDADRKARKAEDKAKKQQAKADKMQARKDYLAKIKGILTPEQYVQFLENSFLNDRGGMVMGHGKKGKMHHSKPGKDGKHKGGPRGQKPAQPQADKQNAN